MTVNKRTIKFIAGILISVIFIYLALRKVDVNLLILSFKKAKYSYILYAFIVTFITFIVRSYRWKFILNSEKNIRLYSLFSATCIGLMSNNILPFRMGDIAQVFSLGKRENLSKSYVFSTIILERLFDLLMLLVLFGFSIFFISASVSFKGIKFAIILCIAGILGISLFIKYIKLIEPFIVRIIGKYSSGYATKVSYWVKSFTSGFRVLRQGRVLIIIIFLSIFLWIIYGFILYLTFISFEINLPFTNTLFVLTLIAISVMIPSSPGYIGTWEYFGVMALGILAIDSSKALSCVFLYHMTQYLPVILIGLLCLAREGISLKDIRAD